MNKPTTTLSALMAGLLLTAGMATAQVASPVPKQAGEASTTGASAQPNPAEKTDKSTSRADVKSEARTQARTNTNSNLPKGEASTTGMNGQPNMAPAGTSAEAKVSTRAERKADRDMKKAVNGAAPVDYQNLAKRPGATFDGAQGTPK
jgi:hypothetical protein